MSEFDTGNYLYIATGTLGAVFNVLIIVVILKAKHLRRKENFMITGLAIFSLIYSLFSVSIGAYRFSIDPAAEVSIEHCLILPQTAAFIFASIGSTVMLLMIALDRVIAAKWFQHYLTLKKSYAVKVIGFSVVFSAVFTLVGYLGSVFQLLGSKVFAFCDTPFPIWYIYLFAIVDLVFNAFTIVLHVLALLIIWYRSKHVHGAVQVVQFKRQRSITVKLSILIILMIFLHTLPRLALAMRWSIVNSVLVEQVLSIAIGLHAAMQVLFYAVIKRELRSGMVNILNCQGTQVSTSNAFPILLAPQPPLCVANEETKV